MRQRCIPEGVTLDELTAAGPWMAAPGSLSPAQQRLLEQLRRGGGAPRREILPRRSPETPVPLSFGQQRLWFLLHLEEESGTTYHLPRGYELQGPLRLAQLEAALERTVARHEALRTTVAQGAEEPRQRVHPPERRGMPVVDLSGVAAEGWGGLLDSLIHREIERPFDLTAGPLARWWLVRLGPDHHVLVADFHHLIADGVSFGVWMADVRALYGGTALETLPVQYGDFTLWQRQWLESEAAERELTYWQRQLEGLPERLELPTDRPRPEVQTSRGAAHFFLLGKERTDAVQALAQRVKGTPFMVFTAVFSLLLERLSGQGEIPIGTPIAGRDRRELEGLVGLFVNTVVLRTRPDPGTSGSAFLEAVRATVLEAFAHQRIPFELLVERLRLRRDTRYNPLFQTFFTYRRAGDELAALGEAEILEWPINLGRAMFDVSLTVGEGPRGLWGWVEYNTDLFDATTALRWRDWLVRAVDALTAAPEALETPLGALELLSAAEHRQLLTEWARPPADLPPAAATPVHRLFEAAAARYPERTAVQSDAGSLTYEALDRRAEALAGTLRSLGVGAEVLVGVQLERSPQLLVALLGVLKAGGAYLPLDPHLPRQRAMQLVKDARPRALLSQRHLPPLPVAPERHLLWLADDGGVTVEGVPEGELPAAPAAVEVHPQQTAYVLYTSGSTGRPKGVAVRHSALANHTVSAVEAYGLEPEDRVLQLASLSFDTSAEEIYPCLAAGATLVLRNDAMLSSAGEFFAALEARSISVLNLPTAYWHELTAGLETTPESPETAAAPPPLPPSLRLTILGGERALPEAARIWHRWCGAAVRTVNTYGPTEATIVVTRGDLEAPLDQEGPVLPPSLGRPIHGARLRILDDALRPVLPGAPGELYLGGAGLARGYRDAPARTAERFGPDPFSRRAGARLYRTGDRARWRADGSLDFLGRGDHQVKISGYRVELGEVEAALRNLPAVEEAVVMARQDGAGLQRLAAYAVAPGADREDLRRRLRDALPDYMVPASFTLLESFPRTPGGKVDRPALPEPDAPATASPDAAFRPPANDLEERLAATWQEVLGLPRVSTADNFFDLGGNSLLLLRVHGKLQARLGAAPPLVTLLQHPTIAALARHLARQSAGPSASAETASPTTPDPKERLRRGRERLRQRRAKRR